MKPGERKTFILLHTGFYTEYIMSKGKRRVFFFIFGFTLLFSSASLLSQQLLQANRLQQLILSGSQMFPSWSGDGEMVFQSGKKGRQNIFLYNPEKDTVVALTADSSDEQHPVWVPGKEAIVYDANRSNGFRLYYLSLKTAKEHSLIPRKIVCREASFTPSRHLVVFSGFDDRSQRWQIFSYDFVYDNLNRLTSENGDCSFPVFSPDGKKIAYLVRNNDGRTKLRIINWYGELLETVKEEVQGRICWSSDGWRILFVSVKGKTFSISSIRNDGSHEEEIFASQHPLCSPAIQPFDKKLTFSMKNDKSFHIMTFLR